MTNLQIGADASDVELLLDDGSTFRLADQRGHPVVLFFYPEDDSGGCTTENQEFSALLLEFEKLGARVVGVSPDTVEIHQKFRKKYGLQVPLAADPQRTTIEAFGLWKLKRLYGREFMGLIRTSLIIDAQGRVATSIKASRIAGHAQKMLDALKAHLAAQ